MARISITSGATAGSSRRAATHYGRRLEEGKALAEHNVAQDIYVQTTTFSYDDLPAASEDELYQKLPVGARVLSAKLKVTTAFAGGTDLTVGLSQPDGTVIDADGLVTATEGAVANLAANKFVDGVGALIGDTDGQTTKSMVVVTANGTFTAGEATLVVEYEIPNDMTQTMNG